MGSIVALASAALLTTLTVLWWLRRRRAAAVAARQRDALDTVQDWPPEAVRVLTIAERRGHELLRQALPGLLVLAQVPLARFLRVPTSQSHREWLQRAGNLNADLLVCDAGSRVLAVIDIRPAEQTARCRRRHERMARVLRAAGISVHVWTEGDLPSATEIRTLLGAELQRRIRPQAASRPTPSRPAPLIPVAEIEELLAEGDQAALDASMEPVPSAFFDDSELAAQPGGAR